MKDLGITIGHRCNATRLLTLAFKNVKSLKITDSTFGSLSHQLKVLDLIASERLHEENILAYEYKSSLNTLNKLIYAFARLEPKILKKKLKSLKYKNKNIFASLNFYFYSLTHLLVLKYSIAFASFFLKPFVYNLSNDKYFNKKISRLFWNENLWFHPHPMLTLCSSDLLCGDQNIEMLTTTHDHYIWAHHSELFQSPDPTSFVKMCRKHYKHDRELISNSKYLLYWSRPIYLENASLHKDACYQSLLCPSVKRGIARFEQSSHFTSRKQLIIFQPLETNNRLLKTLLSSCIQKINSSVYIVILPYSLSEKNTSMNNESLPSELDFATQEGMKIMIDLLPIFKKLQTTLDK